MSKTANCNLKQQITSLKRVAEGGLKILVSAVQSRPSPPVFNYLVGRITGGQALL